MKKLILVLMLAAVIVVSGCIQQGSIAGSSNELPCSNADECRSFIKSTGLSDEQVSSSMERVSCVNNRCFKR